MIRRGLAGAALVAVLVAAAVAAGAAAPPGGEERPGAVRLLGSRLLGQPAWMGVIADPSGTRFLVGENEPVFPAGAHAPLGQVRRVTPVQVEIALAGGREPVRVYPGRRLPGPGGLTLRDVVRVARLEYRQRTVARGAERRLAGEYYLETVVDGLAVLQRDVEPPPPPLELLAQQLAVVRVAQVGPGSWEVDGGQLFATVRAGEPVIWETLRSSGLELSGGGGLGLAVETPVVDARIDRRGFLVASPKLAERAGLRMGDRIVGVNGTPIDGFATLFSVYQQLRTNPELTTVRVEVERGGASLTLTYRLR